MAMTAEEKKAKKKAADKAYNEANKEKVFARKKAYREANKEKIAARKKAYYEANKDKKAAYDRAYREINKERLSAQRAAYAVTHKDVIRERDKEYKKEYLNRDYVKTRNRVRDVKNRLRRRLGIANPPEVLVELICTHNDLRRLIDEKRK